MRTFAALGGRRAQGLRAGVLAAVMVALGCGDPEQASELEGISESALHSWNGYHWERPANPFTLPLVDSMTTSWDGHLATAGGDWSASSVLDLAIEPGDTSNKERRRCKPVVGKIRACNAASGYNGWLGLARVWIADGHIVQAVARVNDTYLGAAPYDDPAARQHVLCQEVGHDFGLGHQTAVSCMDDDNGLFDPAYAHPDAHDYEQLEISYTHLDGADALVSPSEAAKGPYVEDLGGGRLLITWVTWAR